MALAAVWVDWCDFVIWTPRLVRFDGFYREYRGSMRYVPRLEEFYKLHQVRQEDIDLVD